MADRFEDDARRRQHSPASAGFGDFSIETREIHRRTGETFVLLERFHLLGEPTAFLIKILLPRFGRSELRRNEIELAFEILFVAIFELLHDIVEIHIPNDRTDFRVELSLANAQVAEELVAFDARNHFLDAANAQLT